MMNKLNFGEDDDEDFDPIQEDCGESLLLNEEDAQRQIDRYNRLLQDSYNYNIKKPFGRSDPRSILFGL